MRQLIHALGMTLRESVSSRVVYKVILVANLEAIVYVKNEVSNAGTFGVATGSFNVKVGTSMRA